MLLTHLKAREVQPLVSQWASSLVRSPIPFNNNVTHITIPGRTPSKKNSRVCFVRAGKLFNIPSKAYAEWHKAALNMLPSGLILIDIKEVTLHFYAPDKRGTDLSNKAESIMDLLVDKGIIKDDNWFIIPKLILELKDIDRLNPRCEAYIERAQ